MLISICNPQIQYPKTESEAQFELNEPEQNKKCFDFFTRYGVRIKLIGYAAILVTKSASSKSIILTRNNRVTFLCNYTQHKVKEYNVLVQLNVWRDINYTRGFARDLLRFFCSNNIVVTSGEQFPDGVLMWKKFVIANIGKLQIGVILKDSVIELTTVTQFKSLYAQVWGSDIEFAKIRIFVSSNHITVKMQELLLEWVHCDSAA